MTGQQLGIEARQDELRRLIAKEEERLLKRLSWWKRFQIELGTLPRPQAIALRQQLDQLYVDNWSAYTTFSDLKWEYEQWCKLKSLDDRVKAIREQRQKQLHNRAAQLANFNYNRHDFIIRDKDYKRGNPVDNLIRNHWSDRIYEMFDYHCAACGKKADLTLDHFWLPKNEGANFIMVDASGSIVCNVVALCRSCNSSKRDRSYTQFFETSALEKITGVHERLVIELMGNGEVQRAITKWYGTRIATY